MRWTKIVLIFQAAITLIIGFTFMSQVLTIKSFESRNSTNLSLPDEITLKLNDIKQRYTTATYILIFIALIELTIIIKLVT